MGVLFDIAKHEYSRLRPNYGASSDIFRYLILFLYSKRGEGWSAYFDHDVLPGKERISCDWGRTKAPILFASSQGQDTIGNDAFICRESYSDFFKLVLQKIYHSYVDASLCYENRFLVYPSPPRSEGEELKELKDTELDTIHRTGPGVIANSVFEYYVANKFTNDNSATDEMILAGRTVEEEDNPKRWTLANDSVFFLMTDISHPVTVFPPLCSSISSQVYQNLRVNKNSWMNAPCHATSTLEHAIQLARKEIQFKATFMKIIHLDDSVRDIEDSLAGGGAGAGAGAGGGAISSIQISDELVRVISDLDLRSVQARPMLSRYPSVQGYYEEKLASVNDYMDCQINTVDYFIIMLGEVADDEILQLCLNVWIPKVIPSAWRCIDEITTLAVDIFCLIQELALEGRTVSSKLAVIDREVEYFLRVSKRNSAAEVIQLKPLMAAVDSIEAIKEFTGLRLRERVYYLFNYLKELNELKKENEGPRAINFAFKLEDFHGLAGAIQRTFVFIESEFNLSSNEVLLEEIERFVNDSAPSGETAVPSSSSAAAAPPTPAAAGGAGAIIAPPTLFRHSPVSTEATHGAAPASATAGDDTAASATAGGDTAAPAPT